MTTGWKTLVRTVIVLICALIAASCSSSTEITDSSEPTSVEPGSTPAEETRAGEPTAVPDEPEPTAVVPAPTPTLVPNSEPADFRDDSILAISNGGHFAYGGTTSPWNTATSCVAAPAEALAVVNIEEAARGNVAPVGAGLEQAGDVRQMLMGAQVATDQVAILSSCEADGAVRLWLQYATVSADGRLVGVSAPLEFGDQPGESDPYLLRWVDNETIEARVIVEVDPDDFESWTIEHRRISILSGEVATAQVFDYYDDDGFGTRSELTAQGFTYRAINDPGGALGCEGSGIARTIEVDDGDQSRPALGLDGPVFSDVSDLHISATGHIAWTSGCEGYTSAYVGKFQPDGAIADAHFIIPFAPDGSFLDGSFVDYVAYRLTDDGFLAAVGVKFTIEGNERSLAFLRYDLSTDPNFIMTADPVPAIDAAPLFQAVDGVSSWHVGDTLSITPACGGRTLYAKTSTGFVRAFEAHVEIDAIVDAELAPTRTISYEDGKDFNTRTVVVQTECPAEYEGRRVWFGFEADSVQWGLGLQRADLGAVTEVADVLSVREVVQPGTDFVEATFVEVEYLDGTVGELELVALETS